MGCRALNPMTLWERSIMPGSKIESRTDLELAEVSNRIRKSQTIAAAFSELATTQDIVGANYLMVADLSLRHLCRSRECAVLNFEKILGWLPEDVAWWHREKTWDQWLRSSDYLVAKQSLLPFQSATLSPRSVDSIKDTELYNRSVSKHCRTAIIVPIHLSNGVSSVIGWSTNNDSGGYEGLASLWSPLMAVAYSFIDTTRKIFGGSEVFHAISPRQHECLYWAARGKTIGETAKILSISSHTVKDHLRGAGEKLNATSKAQLIARAYQTGILD